MAPGDAGQGRLTRLETARNRLLSQTDQTPSVKRQLGDALGLRLAEPVAARTAYPAFDKVTTDGYAVQAADTFDASRRMPARLDLTEESVGPGETIHVEAGDELPDGTNAVINDADVNRADTTVELLSAVPEGAGVVPAGGEVEKGEQVLDAGRRLRPSDMALLSAVGCDSVPVAEPWTVVIIPTGDNVVTQTPEEGEVRETNGRMLEGLLKPWGGRGVIRDPVVSKPAALRAAIERDLDADVILTIGGTADGRHDHVPTTLESRGTLLANGLAISPGETTATGIVERTPVVALPGPPIACLVAVVQLVRPLLERTSREPVPGSNVDATLAEKLPSQVGVRSFAPVNLEYHADRLEEGKLPNTARPVRPSSEGLRAITRADGWTSVPEAREGYDVGERVTVEEWES